ncbi:hypothetical protein AGDE_01350 [Angomonas deanei]|uniref:MBOAT, membrane-bound O-acyltransferase family, putative n=1 Tax=Angomonas deanei TaxID=59799 RepID=A0A7G2CCR4_9TRYP|nr:hypothetical protein AGDE_01350 [Angomonas deanei]CAD2217610.1 MBOAT, membrane-bound O-acyltransferase family, putative [Angomonas deanei]|eukprot:EPY42573.1 hypothetical protein AGDE_01350 [Angomonas deanei]
MTIMWVTHVAMIFLNFHFAGYSFRWFGLGWLDTAWPILIRWPIQYNMSLLRMIAFNSDYWEYYLLSKEGGGQAVVDKRKKVLQKHLFTCIECAQTRDRNNVSSINISGSMEESLLCYKARTECTRSGEEYKSLRSYLAYVYYAPLFVAGPMISYNAYESYCNFPLRNINRKEIIRYATRIFYNGVTLFVFMHFIHIHAIIVATPPSSSTSTTLPPISIGQRGRALPPHDPSQYEPIDETLSVMSQLNVTQRVLVFIFLLAFLWLKFNVIWKFFRLVSLVEGVDTPEDMPRCFANVVSIQGFWRDWHASFNHWIVRYMYIPMGGKNKKFLTIFPIFFFIAVWHDVELRLLFWALFICIVLVPEIIFTLLFASKRIPIINKIKSNFKLFFALRVIGTELTMMELVLINLVGFAIGADGVGEGIKTFYKIEVYFIYVVVFGFMAAAILSVQDRDEEQYNKYMLRQKYNLITNYHEKSVEK